MIFPTVDQRYLGKGIGSHAAVVFGALGYDRRFVVIHLASTDAAPVTIVRLPDKLMHLTTSLAAKYRPNSISKGIKYGNGAIMQKRSFAQSFIGVTITPLIMKDTCLRQLLPSLVRYLAPPSI